MADKYIIYTLKNEKINEEVQKILGAKGFFWGGSLELLGNPLKHLDEKYIALHRNDGFAWNGVDESQYKELTFRELCELPDVHDEYEKLAERLVKQIQDFWWENIRGKRGDGCNDWIEEISCKLWEKMKPRLGLK